MKKSQLLKIIKEEIEVVLTNDEAQEIFDLDPAALLENFLEEETAIPTVLTKSLSTDRSGHVQTTASAASPDKRAKDERDEIMAWLKNVKADSEYSPEEKAEITAQEHIETMVGGFLELIDLPSGSLEAKQFVAAVEQFRQRLLMLARKAAKAAGAAPEGEEAITEEEFNHEDLMWGPGAEEMEDDQLATDRRKGRIRDPRTGRVVSDYQSRSDAAHRDPSEEDLIARMRLEEEDLEEEKKPSSGLSKKQKSKIAKKASAGKDIGKKGKGFKKVAGKAAEKYGKDAGKRIAAAAMWKNAKR